MALSKEELNERANDEQVKYIKSKICNKDKDKPYVFISYKSDDWKVVLKDIVYRLVSEYGLNVYFDGDFDTHHSLWIEQFPDNMENSLCRGVLAFIDDKYATSYATLLELMYSQAGCRNGDYKLYKTSSQAAIDAINLYRQSNQIEKRIKALNGPAYWKNKDGITIKEMMNELV